MVQQASNVDTSGYLFWDASHPTTRGHSLFANGADAVLHMQFGDVNLDGIVNGQDIALIASNWLKTGSNPADANGDGIVNGQDIVLISSHWLNTFGASGAVPPRCRSRGE